MNTEKDVDGSLDRYPRIRDLIEALQREAPAVRLGEVRSLLRYGERTAALEDLCVAAGDYEIEHRTLSAKLRRDIASLCQACKVDTRYWVEFR